MVRVDPIVCAIPAKVNRERSAWLPLWVHLADTANVLVWLYDQWLPDASREAMFPNCDPAFARGALTILGLLHDLGKATPAFVAHIASTSGVPELEGALEKQGFPAFWPSEYAITHAAAGEMLLVHHGVAESYASIVGAHHGKPQDALNVENEWVNRGHLLFGRKADGDIWVRVQSWLIKWAEGKAGIAFETLPKISQASQMLVCGLLIMADWIASNTWYFPLLPLEDDGRCLNVEQRFEHAMDLLNLPPAWSSEAISDEPERLYDLRFGKGEYPFIPRAAQKEVALAAVGMAAAGMMIIEAPMGAGKTEAALIAAEIMALKFGQGGVFFALPTQATANGIFPRMKEWAARQSEDTKNTITLAHRMAFLNPEYRDLLKGSPGDVLVGEESGLEVHDFFQGRKTRLLANFVTGTIDQLLMTVLRRKHVMLRQLGAAGKVVIVDEVHAYDAYMSQYLKRTLRWLGEWKTPVILLSATLPAHTRGALMDAYLGGKGSTGSDNWRSCGDYPLLTWSEGKSIHQQKLGFEGPDTQVDLTVIEDEDRLAVLDDSLSEGGCAGVICNTVARAQSFAREVARAMPDTDVMLCHAQFVMPQRVAIEQELLAKLGREGNRPAKLVLVGTQVIEQSLDIDLDLLITDLCPMDLLLQRMGRLHRHPRQRPEKLRQARCLVTGCGDDMLHGHPIYEEYLLLRTRERLPGTVTLPGDISPLVQRVYEEAGEEDASQHLRDAREKMVLNIKTQEGRADVYRLNAPEQFSRYRKASLHGLLTASANVDSAGAEASVRGGGPSIEVLLLRRAGEDRAITLGEENCFRLNRTPSAEESVIIARQRLRLPWMLCTPWNADGSIHELERQTLQFVPEWFQSPWLKGELILLLDEAGTARLNGCLLSYDRRCGLICERMEKEAVSR